jgi:hypothetical protein
VQTGKLYEEIGRLKIEMDWLKKNLNNSAKCDKQNLVDPSHPSLSIRHQCELLGVSRASLYYETKTSIKPEGIGDKSLMDLIDFQYSQTPFFPSARHKNHQKANSEAHAYHGTGSHLPEAQHIQRSQGPQGRSLSADRPRYKQAQHGLGYRYQCVAASGVKDGGRSPAVALQEEAANHHKRL